MIYTIKKKLQLLFKRFSYGLFKLFYGEIKEYEPIGSSPDSKIIISKIDNKYSYKVYSVLNARLYTDTINDTAIIKNNKIISGPSFQIRNVKFEEINKNIVFSKGTPRIKKKIVGNLFSLLTGGGGNYNYWHWMFDVLPRIKILSNVININEIDNFLFPNLNKNFQRESLTLLNIPEKKRISSIKCRHIESKNIIATDHPYVIRNKASSEIQEMPIWIIKWLNENLTKNIIKKVKNNFSKKIYIDRGDSTSNQGLMRKIINDQEIKFQLEKIGFQIVKLGHFSLEKQIQIFQNAGVIVGLHGGGFANLIFCKPNTKVIELKPSGAGLVISNLAERCELNYEVISKKPENIEQNNQQGLIKVEIEEILKKI